MFAGRNPSGGEPGPHRGAADKLYDIHHGVARSDDHGNDRTPRPDDDTAPFDVATFLVYLHLTDDERAAYLAARASGYERAYHLPKLNDHHDGAEPTHDGG